MTKQPFEPANHFIFPGFQSPNTTQVPDELFDQLLPDLSGAELKVLLYIIRRTFGFKRDSDTISLSQMLRGIQTRDGRTLDRGVGLSKKTLLQAITSLEAKNIILTERRRSLEKGDEPTAYRLNVLLTAPPRGGEITPPVGEKLHQGGGVETSPGPWGKNYTTQKTVLQETEIQDTAQDSSKESSKRIRNSNHPGGSRGGNSTQPPRPPHTTPAIISPSQRAVRVTSHAGPLAEAVARRGTAILSRPQSRLKVPSRSLLPEGAVADDPAEASRGLVAETGSSEPPERTRGRPKSSQTLYLDAVIRDFSREFHDSQHTGANIVQARNLLATTGLGEEKLVERCYEARSLTRDQANIKKHAADGSPIKNKMPYFFAVVRDLLGMREEEASPGPAHHERGASPG